MGMIIQQYEYSQYHLTVYLKMVKINFTHLYVIHCSKNVKNIIIAFQSQFHSSLKMKSEVLLEFFLMPMNQL